MLEKMTGFPQWGHLEEMLQNRYYSAN